MLLLARPLRKWTVQRWLGVCLVLLAVSALVALQSSKWSFQLQTKPLFEDTGIPLAVMGMLVVFVALVILSLFIAALPRVLTVWSQYHPEKSTRKSTTDAATGDGIPNEVLVVIAAAVNEAIDQPHRIVHMRQLTPEDLNWALAGRRLHHTSHGTTRREH